MIILLEPLKIMLTSSLKSLSDLFSLTLSSGEVFRHHPPVLLFISSKKHSDKTVLGTWQYSCKSPYSFRSKLIVIKIQTRQRWVLSELLQVSLYLDHPWHISQGQVLWWDTETSFSPSPWGFTGAVLVCITPRYPRMSCSISQCQGFTTGCPLVTVFLTLFDTLSMIVLSVTQVLHQ